MEIKKRKKLTEEHKKRIGNSLKGHPIYQDKKRNKKIINTLKGRVMPEETKNKIGRRIKELYNEGKIKSPTLNPEIVKKIQLKRRESYLNGKTKFTKLEYKKRMSELRKGKHFSPSTEFKKGNIPHNRGKTKYNYEPQRKTSESRLRKDIDKQKDYIINLYLNNKKSQFEIAKMLNCDFVVINRILKENNVKLRPLSYYTSGRKSKKIGKTFEELYGKNRAEEIKKLIRKARVKQISPMKGKKWTKIQREKLENIRHKRIFPKRDTSIELKIQKFLSLLHIEYFTHKYISEINHSYQCDIFIPEQRGIKQKIIIECDGCFFHCCPICNIKSTEWTKERRELDKLRTQELIEKGFIVIRLWEHEIKNMKLSGFEKNLRMVS